MNNDGATILNNNMTTTTTTTTTTFSTLAAASIDNELSFQQQQVLALIPKFTSSLSIPCSIFIILEVVSDYKHGRGTSSVQRILVGMSIVDIVASFAWFLSTWAVPMDSGWAYARGNTASCNFQGFLLQIAIGAPLYNSSLALFYTLIVKLRWTDVQLWHIEKYVHLFILTFTIGTSILLLFLDQYNHIGAVCWVIGDPVGCDNSSYQSNTDVPCNRGNWAWLYGLILFYGPLWVCVLACIISMIILYREVKTTVRRASIYTTRYDRSHSLRRSEQNSNKVAVQAILYSLTFLITWMPSTLWSIAYWFSWSHYGLDVAAATAEPLQGLWNFLIFLRNRPQTRRKIQYILHALFPCCCSPPKMEELRSSQLPFSSTDSRRITIGEDFDDNSSRFSKMFQSFSSSFRKGVVHLDVGITSTNEDRRNNDSTVDNIPEDFDEDDDNDDEHDVDSHKNDTNTTNATRHYPDNTTPNTVGSTLISDLDNCGSISRLNNIPHNDNATVLLNDSAVILAEQSSVMMKDNGHGTSSEDLESLGRTNIATKAHETFHIPDGISSDDSERDELDDTIISSNKRNIIETTE